MKIHVFISLEATDWNDQGRIQDLARGGAQTGQVVGG